MADVKRPTEHFTTGEVTRRQEINPTVDSWVAWGIAWRDWALALEKAAGELDNAALEFANLHESSVDEVHLKSRSDLFDAMRVIGALLQGPKGGDDEGSGVA